MLSPVRLCAVAFHGLGDLRAAARSPGDSRDPVLRDAYGQHPWRAIVAIALLAALAGALLARIPSIPMSQLIHWSVLASAITFAILLRRVVFSGRVTVDDFDPLFSTLWIACTVTIVVAGSTGQIRVPVHGGRDVDPLLLAVEVFEAAAIFTVAVATLCYRKSWPGAALDLVTRLIVFKFMIWLAVLLMVEIGIIGKIVGGIVHAVTGWRMPLEIKEIVDRLSYAGLVLAAYLAVIGGIWTVCKQSFDDLIKDGDVDVLAALQELIDAPKKDGAAGEEHPSKQKS